MASLSARAKQQIYSNLEKYARSGMGMEKACQSLLDQPRLGSTERRVYEGILDGIRQGQSIGAALGGASSAVSALECEVVTAAEAGGMLDRGFAHLAEYFRRVRVTRSRILRGLAYPILLLHLALPISTLAVTATKQLSIDGSPVPSFSEAFLETGQVVLLGYVGVALLFAWAAVLLRVGRRSAFVDGLLSRIPLLGGARRAAALERFTQVFEIFLLAGRKMSDSLAGAAYASGSGRILAAGRLGATRIEAGDSLSEALYASASTFPDDFLRGMTAAEESGQLDRELAEWSRFYSDSAREAMERVAEWTPKLFYWAVLVFVAYLVIRVGLAYRDLLMNLLNGTF